MGKQDAVGADPAFSQNKRDGDYDRSPREVNSLPAGERPPIHYPRLFTFRGGCPCEEPLKWGPDSGFKGLQGVINGLR